MLKKNRVKGILCILVIGVVVGCSSTSKDSTASKNMGRGISSTSMSKSDSGSVLQIEGDAVHVAIEEVVEDSFRLYEEQQKKLEDTQQAYLEVIREIDYLNDNPIDLSNSDKSIEEHQEYIQNLYDSYKELSIECNDLERQVANLGKLLELSMVQ